MYNSKSDKETQKYLPNKQGKKAVTKSKHMLKVFYFKMGRFVKEN